MSYRIAVVMDPLAGLQIKKDSTLAMIVAAQQRGWKVSVMEPADLFIQAGVCMARTREISLTLEQVPWYTAGDAQVCALHTFDAVLMRKDPPFDTDYIYTTYLLEMAERAGTLVVNRPHSLRDCNEKLFAVQFPECCPPLVVSSKADVIRQFLHDHGDIVVKPLYGMGGQSIFRIRQGDPNISVIIETLTDHGRTLIMAQRYLPEIAAGDKRILMIDGEPVPHALARIPGAGETGKAVPLSDRDRWICQQVAPELRRRGLLFVGLDVIGDYLTEINVTSPTCIRELDAQCGLDIGGQLLDCLANKLAQRTP